MVTRNLRREPDELRAMMALSKALWKLRPPDGPENPGSRLVRRWREKRLLARLEHEWPGGLVLHGSGDLVHVPSPLDARGRHALLHAPHVHPAALGFVLPGSVVIDVGASLGEWTVPFARKVGPTGRVLAIEPAPRSAAALQSTLVANALRQAELVHCAIGDHDGIVEFAVPIVTSVKTDTGMARIGPASPEHHSFQVPLRSLDSLAAEHGLSRVDLIKIDVEGNERRVLDGAAAVLGRDRPVLVMETGHEEDDNRTAIFERLAASRYRMLGLLLDYGIAPADWPAYVALRPPFRAGEAHNLLLVPE